MQQTSMAATIMNTFHKPTQPRFFFQLAKIPLLEKKEEDSICVGLLSSSLEKKKNYYFLGKNDFLLLSI